MSEKRMSRAAAVAFLASCRYLTAKVAAYGVKLKLNKRDQAVLRGFDRVWSADWLKDYDIAKEAGLNPSDINLLNLVASMETTRNMQQQHASGEQVD